MTEQALDNSAWDLNRSLLRASGININDKSFRFSAPGAKKRQPNPVQLKRFVQLLKLNQSAAACDGNCFRPAENLQLGEDVAQVPFDRGFANVEVRTYFLVALTA